MNSYVYIQTEPDEFEPVLIGELTCISVDSDDSDRGTAYAGNHKLGTIWDYDLEKVRANNPKIITLRDERLLRWLAN